MQNINKKRRLKSVSILRSWLKSLVKNPKLFISWSEFHVNIFTVRIFAVRTRLLPTWWESTFVSVFLSLEKDDKFKTPQKIEFYCSKTTKRMVWELHQLDNDQAMSDRKDKRLNVSNCLFQHATTLRIVILSEWLVFAQANIWPKVGRLRTNRRHVRWWRVANSNFTVR